MAAFMAKKHILMEIKKKLVWMRYSSNFIGQDNDILKFLVEIYLNITIAFNLRDNNKTLIPYLIERKMGRKERKV